MSLKCSITDWLKASLEKKKGKWQNASQGKRQTNANTGLVCPWKDLTDSPSTVSPPGTTCVFSLWRSGCLWWRERRLMWMRTETVNNDLVINETHLSSQWEYSHSQHLHTKCHTLRECPCGCGRCLGYWHGPVPTESLSSLFFQVKTTSPRRPCSVNGNPTPLLTHQERSRQITEGESDRTRCPTADDGRTNLWNTTPKESEDGWGRSAWPPHNNQHWTTYLGINCILPFSTDQHYTPYAEQGPLYSAFYPGLFIPTITTTFQPGAIYPQHQFSQLIKVLHTAAGLNF